MKRYSNHVACSSFALARKAATRSLPTPRLAPALDCMVERAVDDLRVHENGTSKQSSGPARVLASGLWLLFTLMLCRAAAKAQDPVNAGVIPKDRLSEPWWAARHQQILQQVKQHPDCPLLLVGDSITNNYDKANPPEENFQPTWQQFYGSRNALNLGFSGDATEHVLWRLDHGEVDGLHPKLVVLLIGTNNTGHERQTALQTKVGIDAVIGSLEQHVPSARILLLGILPSDVSAEKSSRDAEVNAHLAQSYGESHRVTYLDIGSVFASRDGVLNRQRFYDTRFTPPAKALHPDTLGQHQMAEAIEPTVAKLMGDAPKAPLASMTDINTAIIPVDWLEQDSYDWYGRHGAALGVGRSLHPRTVLLGDSITHFWSGPPAAARASGPVAWAYLFGTQPVLNLGFGWDRTQNVLWRLRAGELEGLAPQSVVLNIGTNNLTGTAQARASTPAETAAGIEAIVRELHTRLPGSRVILMAIFPRGRSAQDPLRAPIAETNRLLAQRFQTDPAVTWIDIGQRFLAPDGTLPASLMPDGTHPSEEGYRIWAEALRQAGVAQGKS